MSNTSWAGWSSTSCGRAFPLGPPRRGQDRNCCSSNIDMSAPPAVSHVAPSAESRRPIWSTLTILLMLAAGGALTVLVFQPGYMTVDARYLYDDMRAWTLSDWQSPVMALLWWLIDPITPGAWSMFLLIAALYWLGFGMLA